MSNLQLYTAAYVYVNGLLLGQEASVQVSRATNSQAINTVVGGYSGESPGAGMTEITVDSVVPSADFELDAGKFMGDLQVVEFSVFAAGKTLTFKGFIISDNFSAGVDTPTKLSFSARGKFANWS